MIAFAAFNNDYNIRLNSSSGGIFTLLANFVIENNGIVYGVAMSLDCRNAEYIRVNDKSELSHIRGSKYFQARMGNIFHKVKDDLRSGLMVLFSGTGCQINGLKGFLGKEYINLYCVDVICHGVPSPKLWREYVQYVENQQKSRLIGINFRCKDDSWTDFGIKRVDDNHKAMYISKDKDPFMLMFLRDYSLRPSCYACIAKKYKQSDLTIADFWGIDKVVSGMNDGKGVSLVITRTEKGQKLFDDISEKAIVKTISYEDGVKYNPAEFKSAIRPKERDFFFKDMNTLSFEELKRKFGTPKPIPLKRKIKKIIKKIILNTPAQKFMGGGTK